MASHGGLIVNPRTTSGGGLPTFPLTVEVGPTTISSCELMTYDPIYLRNCVLFIRVGQPDDVMQIGLSIPFNPRIVFEIILDNRWVF